MGNYQTFHNLLQVPSIPIAWYQIVLLLLGGGGITAIVIFILKWVRFKKADVVGNDKTKAEIKKIEADANETNARADVTVAETAFKLLQRLSDDCDSIRKQLEISQVELDKALDSLRDATITIAEIKHELNNEKTKNTLNKERIQKMNEEIEELNLKLKEDGNNKKDSENS